VSPLTAILAFLVLPIALGIIVYVLLSAGSWTRSGRASADYDGGPFLVTSDAAVPNPSHLPREIGVGPEAYVGGGASAQW
jgi:hypothetical protein